MQRDENVIEFSFDVEPFPLDSDIEHSIHKITLTF